MATLRLTAAVLICALPGLLIGCGPPEFETVTGTVTFDNEPVKKGIINFQPADAMYGPDAGEIIDGKFTLRARPGSRKVVIRAARVIPDKKGPMGHEEVFEDYIPAKYNDETTLTAEVQSGVKNEFVFPLKSK